MVVLCGMEKQLSVLDAWQDFFAWIRLPEQKPLWAAIPRKKKQYIYKAEIARKEGKLGYERVKSILLEYAPKRYLFNVVVTLRT